MKGILRFSNDSKLTTAVPVEVRKSNLVVVKTGMTSDSMELEAGEYFVTAQMPAGQELYGQIKLGAGKEATVNLAPDPSDESPPESQAAPHYLLDEQRNLRRDSSEKGGKSGFWIKLSKTPWTGNRWLDKLLSVSEALSPPELRFFRGNLFEENLIDVTKEMPPVKFQGTAKDLLQIRINGSSDGGDGDNLLLVQIIKSGAPALNMVLPAFSEIGCTLVIRRGEAGFYALDANLKNVAADLLLRYTHKGFQQQAELTAKAVNAENLLFEKRKDPIAAAVGAYALLRFGELERLHDWTENLRRWFPLLPDGAAIRGEHLAREGRHEEAADAFLELDSRGIPVFSEGLSYAASRLRFYTKLIKGNKFGGNYEEKVNRLLDKLQRFAAYTDFRQPIMTFTGVKPNAPDDAEYKGKTTEAMTSKK